MRPRLRAKSNSFAKGSKLNVHSSLSKTSVISQPCLNHEQNGQKRSGGGLPCAAKAALAQGVEAYRQDELYGCDWCGI